MCNYEWAKSELQRAQVQLKALQAREAATVTQEAAYRAMARKLGEDAITQDDLLSTEKAAQENYLLYVKKQEEARMDDALDERGIVNVAIAEHPVVPALPVSSAWTVLAIGLAAAGAGRHRCGICGGLSGSCIPHAGGCAGVLGLSGVGVAAAKGARRSFRMREGVMSAGVLFARSTVREKVRSEEESAPEAGGWNPEDFAREQIRGLVRQVFFSNVERPVRQVVFSAMDPETDVKSICRQVGEALALETAGSVALVGEHPQVLRDPDTCQSKNPDGSASLREAATRLREQSVAGAGRGKERSSEAQVASLHSHLGAVRREFEYSILAGTTCRRVERGNVDGAVRGRNHSGVVGPPHAPGRRTENQSDARCDAGARSGDRADRQGLPNS